MNEAFVKNLLSLVIAVIGSFLTAKGLLTTDQLSSATAAILNTVGPIMVLVSLVWGYINHTPESQIASTAKLSQVRKVVTNEETALKVAKPNVVSKDTIV